MINIKFHEYEIKAVNSGKGKTSLWFADNKILYVEFSKEKLSERFSTTMNFNIAAELNLYIIKNQQCLSFSFLNTHSNNQLETMEEGIFIQNCKKIQSIQEYLYLKIWESYVKENLNFCLKIQI